MYNVKKSDQYRRGTTGKPRRSRRDEMYYNRTRGRQLRKSNHLFRLTTVVLALGLISLILWSMG
jgi:hypothetical protein